MGAVTANMTTRHFCCVVQKGCSAKARQRVKAKLNVQAMGL
jgi:hypothetical protein